MQLVHTPVGQACVWCGEAIVDGDDGVIDGGGQPWHGDCWVRQVSGGVNHLKGTCSCRGGKDPPDPPELSRREAASEAVRLFEAGHL